MGRNGHRVRCCGVILDASSASPRGAEDSGRAYTFDSRTLRCGDVSDRVPVGEYLRPSKWRNAVRRRIFAARVPRCVELHPRSDTEFVGTAYGGWPVPVQLLSRSSVVYSVGAGGDVTFDLGLIERTGCEVHSFDPTPEAARHVAAHAHPRLTFHNVAIWTHTGELTMHRAADPRNMALSAVNLQHTDRSAVVRCQTIESARAELGHDSLPLIKLTVDGGEYDLLPQLALARWDTRVLVVALHHNRPVRAALDLIAALRNQGFVPVARKGTGYTFVCAGHRAARRPTPQPRRLPVMTGAR
jgi:FkbM family methyltransferase